MKKLWMNIFKGLALFIIGIILSLLSYLESSVFEGDLPYKYRLIVAGIGNVILILFGFLALRGSGRAIRLERLEKERRINQWHITGVRPEDQKAEEE